MRNSIVAALVLALGMCAYVRVARAADEDKTVKVSGVVIDQMCGEKMLKKDDPQKAAEGHKKDCALKCGPEAGYAIISEGKMTKLSADSKDKVEEYLKKEDSKTEVTISGTKQDDGSIKVSEIMAKS